MVIFFLDSQQLQISDGRHLLYDSMLIEHGDTSPHYFFCWENSQDYLVLRIRKHCVSP